MNIGSNFIVINVYLKVASINPLFILISIDKIFTINGSIISIVFVIFIVIVIIILYMCKRFILRIWNCNLKTCGCLLDFLGANFCTRSNFMYNSIALTWDILSILSSMIFTCLFASIAIHL